jgi:hypothetical protein
VASRGQSHNGANRLGRGTAFLARDRFPVDASIPPGSAKLAEIPNRGPDFKRLILTTSGAPFRLLVDVRNRFLERSRVDPEKAGVG